MDRAHAALRRLAAQVRAAQAAGTALEIRGGGTKRFYGETPRGEPLSTAELAGILSYEPTELVVTAYAGTPLAELEAVLAERGQCLAFEPPRFAAGGTVGGMVAAGLSGPARMGVGAVRDFVLGARLMNGNAELLNFGGQVMKNVAGYDVSRLLAGSWGILGLLCEVSLKVLPVRPATLTLSWECDEAAALGEMLRWTGQPLPVHATRWDGQRLVVRLAGAQAAVEEARQLLGGVPVDPADAERAWQAIRDHQADFFRPDDAALSRGECLWRLAVPPRTPPLTLTGRQLIEWGGGLRWWRTDAPAPVVRAAAGAAGGHATLVRAAGKPEGAFSPLAPALLRIHQDLKAAFDPGRVFNPGRLYPGL
jgi:glycolate oxidase FAD binding subunit